MSRRIVLPLCTILVLAGAVAGSLFLSSSPTSWDDGLRHITMARVMRSEGIDQTWSQFFYGGYLANHPVDPWFLADVSYIPFTVFSDPVALRLYTIIGILVYLLAVWRLIAPLGLSTGFQCILLTLAIAHPEILARFSLGRPFVWAVVFSLLTLDAVLRRSVLAVVVVLLIATLFSQLFVFPLAFVLAGALWMFLQRRRSDAQMITVAAIVGTVSGLVLHPHARAYLSYLHEVFLRIPFASRSLSLGSEMYPSISASAAVAVLGVSLLLFAGGIKEKSLKMVDLGLQGTSLIMMLILPLFGAYLFAWMRAIDFLWPLLVVLLAHALSLSHAFSMSLFGVSMKPLFPRIRGGQLVSGCIVLAFFAMTLRTGFQLRASDDFRSMNHLAPIASLPAGSSVLNPEWFFLPPLIAANPHVKFATGIDNMFTWKASPDAYNLLEVYFSLAAQIPHPVVDIRSWMTQLLAIYPSDYLVISKQWGKNLLPQFRTTRGLTALTVSGAVIEVFAIDADEFTDIP